MEVVVAAVADVASGKGGVEGSTGGGVVRESIVEGRSGVMILVTGVAAVGVVEADPTSAGWAEDSRRVVSVVDVGWRDTRQMNDVTSPGA